MHPPRSIPLVVAAKIIPVHKFRAKIIFLIGRRSGGAEECKKQAEDFFCREKWGGRIDIHF
eukprot:6675013-Karenia_brevis.AAC.1